MGQSSVRQSLSQVTPINANELKSKINNKETFVLFVKQPTSQFMWNQERALERIYPKFPIYSIDIPTLKEDAFLNGMYTLAEASTRDHLPMLFRWNNGIIKLPYDIYDYVLDFIQLPEYIAGQWVK